MGRKPRQEPLKEYLENPRTTWLFSQPVDFTEVFPQGDKATTHLYLDPATKGTRLGKGTYRIVLHLPNKHHNDRSAYLQKIAGGSLGRYLEGGPLEASRIRWDSGSFPSAELVLHTQRGKRVNFYLLPASHEKGAVVYATTSFPSARKSWKPLKDNTTDKKAVKDKNGKMGKWVSDGKLVQCGVKVGFLGASKSNPGKFKLKLEKPQIDCAKGLVAAGHAPKEFLKPQKPKAKGKAVKNAETMEQWMSEDDHRSFYAAQGIDYDKLLEIQDVEIMDSETQEQAQERAYYNPSEAMVGTDETLDGYSPVDSATVDLTSLQPTANYGAEGETATYAPSEEPDMVSSSSFDEPTNAHFSAEGCPNCGFGAEGFEAETVADVEASVEPANEPLAVAEGVSLDGYASIDSLEEGAPIGHGVNQYFGSAEGTEEALLDESTTNITVEEGVSLDGYSGVDSVAVEAPLGHGVTQWYAEDSPEPNFDEGITGQDGPSADPSNSNFSAESFREYHASGRTGFVFPKRKAWPIGDKKHAIDALAYMKRGWGNKSEYPKIRSAIKKKYGSLNLSAQGYNDRDDESFGMRHRGVHEQSLKDRRDESKGMTDSLNPHHPYSDVSTMSADFSKSKGRNYARNDDGTIITHDAEFEGETMDNFKKGLGLGSGAVVGIALPGLLLSTAAFLSLVLLGKSQE